MYYSHTCSYCSKLFYTYNEDKDLAAKTLYAGIEAHMKEYNESEDASFYHDPELDTNRIYSEIVESSEEPSSGYEL